MPSIIAEAVRTLKLQPGESKREVVDGHTAELRLLGDEEDVTPELAEMTMVDLWPKYPRGEGGFLVKARVVDEPSVPPPFHIDESDLAPE